MRVVSKARIQPEKNIGEKKKKSRRSRKLRSRK